MNIGVQYHHGGTQVLSLFVYPFVESFEVFVLFGEGFRPLHQPLKVRPPGAGVVNQRRRRKNGLPRAVPIGFELYGRLLVYASLGLSPPDLLREPLAVFQVLSKFRDMLGLATQPVGDVICLLHNARIKINESPLAEQVARVAGDVATLLPVLAKEVKCCIAARPDCSEVLRRRDGLLRTERFDLRVQLSDRLVETLALGPSRTDLIFELLGSRIEPRDGGGARHSQRLDPLSHRRWKSEFLDRSVALRAEPLHRLCDLPLISLSVTSAPHLVDLGDKSLWVAYGHELGSLAHQRLLLL